MVLFSSTKQTKVYNCAEDEEDDQEDKGKDLIPQRTSWSVQDDLALIRAYVYLQVSELVLMEYQSAYLTLSFSQAKHQTGEKPNAEQWEQVGQLMNKPARVCKRRFGLLMKSQHWDSTMQTLIDQVNLRKTRATHGHTTPGCVSMTYSVLVKLLTSHQRTDLT